jgi:hypothetical protein
MTQYARPDSDVSDGNWVNESLDQDNLYASIDNASTSDSDYVYSTDDGWETSSMTVGLGNVTDPSSAADHIVRYRAKGVEGSAGMETLTVELLETSTQRATETITPTTSYVDHSFTLTTAEANAISNYDNLRLKLTRGGTDGGYFEGHISQAYFECPDASVAAVSNPAFLLFID